MLYSRQFYRSVFGLFLVLFVSSARAELMCSQIVEENGLSPYYFQILENKEGGTTFGTLFLIRNVESAVFPVGEELGLIKYMIRGDVLRILAVRAQNGFSSNLVAHILSAKPSIQKISFNLGESHQNRMSDLSFEIMQKIVENPSEAHYLHPYFAVLWQRGFYVERASLLQVGDMYSLNVLLSRRTSL